MKEPNNAPWVAVIILNYQRWQDTIACLTSLFQSDYPHFQIMVCDNGSSNRSLEQLEKWVATQQPPIRYVVADRTTLEMGPIDNCDPSALMLGRIETNLGFGGGCNVGLRYVLRHPRFRYVWLLNNDTIVAKDALTHLVNRAEQVPNLGMCGSKLLHDNNRTHVQALGGATYNKWFATVHPVRGDLSREEVERQMSYVIGASMLVSVPFIREVGLLAEDYFLYFDELDWVTRARGRYRLAFAPESIVYHQEGGTIQTEPYPEMEVGMASLYYFHRGRLRFTRKFYPWALPTVYLAFLFSIGKRLCRREWKLAKLLTQSLFTS